MKIGSKYIGIGYPCFIIAELGTAHLGNKKKAFALIDAAADAGADCVKFQHVYADEILHPLTGNVALPGGTVDLYKRFKELEVPVRFLEQMKEYAEKKKLEFLCTPFGIRSARELKSIDVNAIKIASPELNHLPLLEEIASYNIPVILSTGVSLLGDIEKALNIFNGNAGAAVAILHCITVYPAPEEEYNLRLIPGLENIFGVLAGVSDHSIDPLLVPVLAVWNNACIIEKHFTLSKESPGLDDKIALCPDDFRCMVQGVREMESLANPSPAIPSPASKDIPAWFSERCGEERIARCLGSGIKRLALSEEKNYFTTRRSIHARITLIKGDALTYENTGLYRSEKNLAPGLDPGFLKTIIGKKAVREIPAGHGITWDDLLSY